MIATLKRWLGIKPKLRNGFKVYRTWGGYWGHSIGWVSNERMEISGHMTPKPRVGDEVRSRMQSGKIGRFVISHMADCRGVPDMFFATVYPLAYTDGTPIPTAPCTE